MRTRNQVELNEAVCVFDINGSRLGQPAGGWPGTVTKAGPKLVTVAYNGTMGVFRRKDGSAAGGGHQHYLTVDEAEEAQRARAARKNLAALGVEVTPRCNLSAGQLEAMLRAVQ